MNEKAQSDDATGLIVVTAAMTIVLMQIGRMWTGEGLFSSGLFMDSDVYMWLNRTEALAEGRGWFDHLEQRINPPQGHVQHWTRPMDLLLLLGGYALSPVLGFRDGLALWANLLSPLLFLPAIWLMYRTARLLTGTKEAVLAAAIFSLHPMILLAFAWGRADHQSLLVLGLVGFLYALLRFFLQRRHRRRWAFLAGWIGAWAMWANVEALGFVLIGLTLLGLWWLWGRRDLVIANVTFAGGLWAGIVAAVVLERGTAFFETFPVDTMGMPYVVLFALNFAFWLGLAIWSAKAKERGGLPLRLVVAAVLASVVLGALALSYPMFFSGPFAEVDDLYRQVRLQFIGEQLPALRLGIDPPLASVGRGITFFGIALVGLVGALKRARQPGPATTRWAWALFGAMTVLYAVLALDTVRWSTYLPAVAAPGYAVVGVQVLAAIEGKRHRFGVLLRPLVVGALLLGFSMVGLGLTVPSKWAQDDDQGTAVAGDESQGQSAPAAATAQACDLRPALAAMADDEAIADEALIMIDPDRGAEVLYRSDYSVLAIANHRWQPGFTLFYEVMTAEDVGQAHRQLRQREVAAVMVCSPEVWPALRRDGQAFIEVLARGEAVPGFRSLAAPEAVGQWQIYEVVGAGTDSD